MITIGLHFGTYLSEVYRGALEGVSKTQWEACRALNFSTIYTYRRIVLPQAFPIAIPGMGNYLVGIFKDTPLLSTIGVAELLHAATAVGGRSCIKQEIPSTRWDFFIPLTYSNKIR